MRHLRTMLALFAVLFLLGGPALTQDAWAQDGDRKGLFGLGGSLRCGFFLGCGGCRDLFSYLGNQVFRRSFFF